MKIEKETARFWVFWQRGWVKISVPRGKSRRMFESHAHEEGYSFTDETYYHMEDGTLVAECVSGGRDCDGRLEHYTTLEGHANLIDDPHYDKDDDEIYIRPRWKVVERSQWDQYAELAGY